MSVNVIDGVRGEQIVDYNVQGNMIIIDGLREV